MNEKGSEFSLVIPNFRCLWDIQMETFSHIVGRIEDFPRKKLDQKRRFSSYEHIECQKSMGLLTKEVVCKDKED